MKEKLIETKHPQSRQIQDRHSDVLRRYHLTVFLVSSPNHTQLVNVHDIASES